MKLLHALMIAASALAVAGAVPDASAATKGKKETRAAKAKPVATQRARSSTTTSDGLCQRDSGKPASELNFRDRCDMEEFWNRFTPAT